MADSTKRLRDDTPSAPAFDSLAGDRHARRDAWWLALSALVCAALAVAVVPAALADSHAPAAADEGTPAAAGAEQQPPAAPGVSQTLMTTVVRPVTMRSGRLLRVTYRADDSAGGDVTVDLVVTSRDGAVVRRLVQGRVLAVGVDRTWSGRLRLPPGPYLLVAHARDAAGLAEASARPATLRMLAPLPPLVPTAHARSVALAWAARRAGRVAVAVIDSRGRLHGLNERRPFITASVVKAMLLVAYLRAHRSVGSGMRAALTRMIVVSDNAAADLVYGVVGRRGVTRLARLAHMSSFRAGGAWITSRVAAADMARFFRDMESYVPRRHRRFANRLLAHVTASQRWGIPPAAGLRGYRVYCKPGWLGAWVLASEAARLERGRVRIGLAVFTDDNPTSTYGKETIAGVTARLLHR